MYTIIGYMSYFTAFHRALLDDVSCDVDFRKALHTFTLVGTLGITVSVPFSYKSETLATFSFIVKYGNNNAFVRVILLQ